MNLFSPSRPQEERAGRGTKTEFLAPRSGCFEFLWALFRWSGPVSLPDQPATSCQSFGLKGKKWVQSSRNGEHCGVVAFLHVTKRQRTGAVQGADARKLSPSLRLSPRKSGEREFDGAWSQAEQLDGVK